jgi:adenylate cyclase class IV
MAETIEVELRYKVADPQVMIRRLNAAGMAVASKKHLIDQWFAPTRVRSMAQEEQWFDEDHGLAWRIRRIEQSDGSLKAMLDSKQLTEDNNHNTFKETPPEDVMYDEAVAKLKAQDYRCWLTIDKTRYTFESSDPHIEVVLDEIAGMGEKIGVPAGLEIEFKGEGNRDEALGALAAFATELGLDEADRFERSFTVESMQALADFET